MGLFDMFKGKAITAPVGRDPEAWGMLQGVWPGRWQESASLFKTPTVAMSEQAYRHPVVRACVSTIASAMTETGIAVGRESYGEFEEIEWHPSLDLLTNPNPFQSLPELIMDWIVRTELTGLGYIRKVRNAGKGVAALVSYPTSWVEVRKVEAGINARTAYKVWGSEQLVPAEDMIVLRLTDPSSIFGSCSPMQSGHTAYALDREREDFLAELFLNMQIPGLIFRQPKGFPSSDARKQAKKDLKNMVGRGHRGEPLLLEGEGDIKMEAPLQDMDWPGMQGSMESRICMAFGVPPIVINSRFGLERATHSNYEQAEKAFYTRIMRPKWVVAGAVLTRGLIRDEWKKADIRLQFRYDTLPQFREGETEKATRVALLKQSGIIGRSEARAELGYTQPFPAEDEPEPLPFTPADPADPRTEEEGSSTQREET